MSVLPDPISGGDILTNCAGIDDRWTCPNCYADHVGSLEDETVECVCGATLKLTIRHDPVCVAEAIAFEAVDK